MELVSDTWPALCAIAVSLGLRHGFDADHLTVIDGLVRRNAALRPRLARVAGILFSLGHGAVVMVVACATLIMASRWSAPPWLEPAGMLISATVLLSLAALNLYAVWATPQGMTVTPVGLRSRLVGRAFASDHPLMLAGLGALFAISADTLAQAAALGLAASQFGGIREAAMVAGCFAAGMVLASGINGYWMARLIRMADRRAAIASRVMTGAVGLMSLTVGLLILTKLFSPHLAIASLGGSAWAGAVIIAAAGIAFAIAMLVSRRAETRSDSSDHDAVARRPQRFSRLRFDAPPSPEGRSEAA
ncbi:MAG: nickel transporter [Sphingomonas bacterium]|nr:nickel transporter [Sphingomonas bacterium]